MSVSKTLLIAAAMMAMTISAARAESAPAAEAPAPEAAKEEPATDEAAPAKEESAPANPAAEKAEKPAVKKSEKKADVIGNPDAEKNNPVQVWIAAENKLVDTLSPKAQETFFVMRNKHGVIRAIKVVERDIKNAVKACGKNNPDMKATMEDRFKQWQDAVLPTIELAEKYLKEEIDTQQVVHASDFRYILALNDKAYEYGESRIEKQPVTSKDACEDLLDSMDRTENNMVEMLQDMLLPESVIRDRAARAKEAEEAEKARKASE